MATLDPTAAGAAFAERIRCPLRGQAGTPRLQSWTVTPPAAGAGVCEVCHGPAGHPYRRCWSCEVVRRRLGLAVLPPVLPISLFAQGSPLHAALAGYKSDPDPRRTRAWSVAIAELVGWFLALHGRCLARAGGGGWDVLDVVPSTRRPGPEHPLAAALRRLPALGARTADLLQRGTGTVGRLEPSAAAFALRRPAAGVRVLLLDDVFTSGSRALSAAAALQAGGAEVVAVVPVGRLVHAEREPTRAWWQHHGTPGHDRPASEDGSRCAARRCGAPGASGAPAAIVRPAVLRAAAACRASSP